LGIYYQSADFFSFLYQLRGILLKFSLFGAIFMPVCSAECQGALSDPKKSLSFWDSFCIKATALELLSEHFEMMLKWFFYSRRRRLCETRCAEFAESQ